MGRLQSSGGHESDRRMDSRAEKYHSLVESRERDVWALKAAAQAAKRAQYAWELNIYQASEGHSHALEYALSVGPVCDRPRSRKLSSK